MKKTMSVVATFVAVAALLLAAPAMSQAPGAKAPASSQAPGARAPAPAATPEKPESSEPPAKARTRSRRHVDARECLRFPTNMEIHRCSLKYL